MSNFHQRLVTYKASDIPNFGTSDKRLQDGSWVVSGVGSTHRDADPIEASNHEVVGRMLASVDPDGECHELMHVGHWAVGWVGHWIVDASSKRCIEMLQAAAKSLDEYPILDEDHHSQLEYEWHDQNACSGGCTFCEEDQRAHDESRCGNDCPHCDHSDEDRDDEAADRKREE